MDINYALSALKQGLHVRREGWKQFELYLKVVLNSTHEICVLFNNEGDCMKWSWSYDDLTAHDWEIVS